MAKQGGRHVTTSETIAINDLLKQHTKPTGEPGMIEYADGYDDKRIASMIGDKLSQYSVARIRQELFGKLQIKSNSEARIDARFDALEKANRSLIVQFSELTSKHNTLIDNLVLNKIVDVKHLKVAGGVISNGKVHVS